MVAGRAVRPPYCPDAGRLFRIACTCGLPGLSAFSNSTPASSAICDGVPPIHCWKTSLTRASCPAAPLAGEAQLAGYPDRVTSFAEPV